LQAAPTTGYISGYIENPTPFDSEKAVLTELAVKGARPRENAYKLFDEKGLYLLVPPSGSRLWRFKYFIDGREKLVSVGRYPDVSLKLARNRRDEARRLVANQTDPSAERKAAKRELGNSVRHVADEWLHQLHKSLHNDTVARVRNRLEDWVYPEIASRAIGDIKPNDLLALLRRIEAKGRHETAHRTRADLSRLMRYAVATGRAERDITTDLKGALAPVKARHFAALVDPMEVGALLRAINTYHGDFVTGTALKFLPYVFVRPGELRTARWHELNLDGAQPEWRIPAEKTKMRRAHVVPLSQQAVAILKSLRDVADARTNGLIFPAPRDPAKPMSENTLNAALDRLGYRDRQTAHGFRSIASTLLNEAGWHPDLIELQLAHKERNETRAAYNRALRIAERRSMMQAWADALDELRANGSIQSLSKA
jgi:integrase